MTQQCSETFTQGNAVFHVRTIYCLLPKSQLEIVLRSLKKHLVCRQNKTGDVLTPHQNIIVLLL